MLAPIGLFIVLGAVIGGFLMAGGHLAVLYQPAEFVIIGGAALGALIAGTPPKVLKEVARQLAGLPRGGPSKQDYTDLLVMLYGLLNLARKDGIIALEKHIEAPEKSEILSQNKRFLHDHHATAFMVDTLRLAIAGSAVEPHDLEALMDTDIESHHKEASGPSRVLSTIGDALPGLGIVAAVLGIVITMEAIDGPPEVIGHKVGAALVGTFLGILLSYGFMQPLSSSLAAKVEENAQYVVVIKQVLLAFQKGCHPKIAVEFARRSLFSDVRPAFTALEQACSQTAKTKAA